MTQIAAFYKFVTIEELEPLQLSLQELCQQLDLYGTILLAREGINATVSGSDESIAQLVQWLKSDRRFDAMNFKFSRPDSGNPVFFRMKVRLKDEIVALRKPGVDPSRRMGTELDATSWNALLEDPDVVLVDTRNSYEVMLGSFPTALNPETSSFREFPDYVERHLDPGRDKKVAMFCTGGIRCEKASAYMLEQGFDEVYQLQGGILNYLATVAPEENRWQGECFVFDQRVAVDRELNEGDYAQCYACRRPIKPSDMASPHYRKGVSCPYCYNELTPEKHASLEERERQMELAKQRGERHLGAPMVSAKTG